MISACFFEYFGLPRSNVSKIIGNNNPLSPGVEATLDSQYIMGIGLNVPTWFWSVNASSLTEIADLFFDISNTADTDIPFFSPLAILSIMKMNLLLRQQKFGIKNL